MEQVTSTRTELLIRRARLALAGQGRDLLEQKRDQLMEEVRKVAHVAMRGGDELARAAADAKRAIDLAEAFDGPEALASAANAATHQLVLDVTTTSIMGVRIADITHPPVGRPSARRGYSLTGSSPRIDAVADRIEAEVELLLEMASVELRLRRLADEIGKTARRINAIELIVIPRLLSETRFIQSVLDERERQDRFRLKRIKDRAAKRGAAA